MDTDDSKVMKDIHVLADRLQPYQKKYMRYCLDGDEVSKRDYNLLREFLRDNIVVHRQDILLAFRKSCSDVGLDLDSISLIYDVGAGHDGWADILQAIFPKAMIILIDKGLHFSEKYRFRREDIFNIIAILSQGEHVLYFLSEFLHCKKKNFELLDTTQLVNSNVMINELCHNIWIQKRLSLSGGKLLDSWDISERIQFFNDRENSFVNYQSSFEYFVWLFKHPSKS